MTILYALLALVTLGVFTYKAIHDMHMFQQNSYRADRYLRWMQQTHQPVFKKSDWMMLLALMPTLIALYYDSILLASGLFLLLSPLAALSVLMFHVKITFRPAKKKLAWTPRVKRLYITSFILANVIVSAVFIMRNPVFTGVAIIFVIVYSWALVIMSNLINQPIEAAINHFYYLDAKKRLARNPNMIVIGITGSYGKTSVKNVLYSLLSRKYNVLMTPESYNTLLGVVRTIREKMNPTHDVFIVEMGAKEIGDIAKICKLVTPDIGIITSIGPQHLDSFKTLENVIRTKGELFEGIKLGGKAFLNLNDENICSLPQRADIDIITFGSPRGPLKTQFQIVDERLDQHGTAFAVEYLADGLNTQSEQPRQGKGKHGKKHKEYAKPVAKQTAHFRTKLLGSHNIENMLGSIAIAMELGIPVSDINRALFDLLPIKHRLSLYVANKGYTVIDDAFNSNPVGSKNALEVLKKFAGNKKIVMTPGMIELGEHQFALNEKFGEYIADACDYVILVGKKQTEPIMKGLNNKKFPAEKRFIVDTVQNGFAKVNELAGPGDVLLIENDLPDSFNE